MADPQLTRRVLPPIDGGDQWSRDVTDELNSVPPMSVFSFTTPNSNVTALASTLGFNQASASSVLWVKQTGSGNTGWVALG
jgi:hypothetical protein